MYLKHSAVCRSLIEQVSVGAYVDRRVGHDLLAYRVDRRVCDLREKLLDPKFDGKTFVEASPYDRIWGVGLAQDDPAIDDERNWKGRNLLGKAITEVRDILSAGK